MLDFLLAVILWGLVVPYLLLALLLNLKRYLGRS